MNAESQRRSTDQATSFGDQSDDQVVHYGSPSALAIVSLLLGLGAPLAFVAPVLLTIPLFGVALALIAIYRISTSEGALIGRRAALVALALCVGSGVGAIARNQVMQSMRYHQAERLVRQWIDLVAAGQIEPAFRLTYRGVAPESSAAPSIDAMATETVDPLRAFQEDPLIEAIVARGTDAEVHRQENLLYEPLSRGACRVRQRFSVAPPGEASESIELEVTSQLGPLRGETNFRWLITTFSLDNAHDHHGHHDHHSHHNH